MNQPGIVTVGRLFVFCAMAWIVTGCDRSGSDATTSRPVAVVISGDTGPWIVPCGCTANQSGGLLRRATFLAQSRAATNVIYADAGGAAAGTSEYFKEKFLAVLRGELAMGISAHNLGKAELAFGPDAISQIASELKVPFVSANARSGRDGKPLAPATRVVAVGGLRVALVGVASTQYATVDVKIDDPRQSISAALQSIKGTYDRVIVLAYLPDDELQQLAASLPEADAVIGGPTGQAQAPRAVGPTLVGAATNKGKFLIRLHLPTTAGPLKGEVVEMSTALADDATQTANVQRYLKRLADLDLPATETGLITPVTNAPASYRAAGSDSCLKCHVADAEAWHHSAHSHAGQTLARKGSFDADPYCLQCHATNFGLPGGFVSPKRTPALMVVGCESCHGPSAAHVERPSVHTTFAAMDQCIRCHDHENSPTFDREKYWAKIKHGKREIAK